MILTAKRPAVLPAAQEKTPATMLQGPLLLVNVNPSPI